MVRRCGGVGSLVVAGFVVAVVGLAELWVFGAVGSLGCVLSWRGSRLDRLSGFGTRLSHWVC